MPHSSELLRQGDGEGKGCDGGARCLRKGEGRAGGDQPLGAAGHFDPGKGQSGSPGGENLRKSYPAGQPPGTGFREDWRAECTTRPKGPESGPRPETLGMGSTMPGPSSAPRPLLSGSRWGN